MSTTAVKPKRSDEKYERCSTAGRARYCLAMRLGQRRTVFMSNS